MDSKKWFGKRPRSRDSSSGSASPALEATPASAAALSSSFSESFVPESLSSHRGVTSFDSQLRQLQSNLPNHLAETQRVLDAARDKVNAGHASMGVLQQINKELLDKLEEKTTLLTNLITALVQIQHGNQRSMEHVTSLMERNTELSLTVDELNKQLAKKQDEMRQR